MINVRELKFSDIELIADYWVNLSPKALQKMGVDPLKMPAKKAFELMLNHQLSLPIDQRLSYCLIWELDKKPIGHCNTNPTKYGENAVMHLHLWDKKHRRKGLGTTFLRMSLPHFFKHLKLKNLYCEPYTLNAAPNKILKTVGFQWEKDYRTTPGNINYEQMVSRWIMSWEMFKKM